MVEGGLVWSGVVEGGLVWSGVVEGAIYYHPYGCLAIKIV